MRTERVTLAGAGLVGSLAAIYFARRGFEVEVYERRPDLRREAVGAGRSINLAISTRGLSALLEVGLKEKILEHVIPMRGRMIHSPSGELSFQPYGKDDSECINSVSRAALNRLLMDAAEKTGVRIEFHQRALGFDPSRRELELRDERTGATRKVAAPVIIGTDGSASAIRGEILKALGPGRASISEEYLSYGYKELTIPPGPGGSFLLEKNALHIWPRGTFMLIALPNSEGSFTCTLFLPAKQDGSGAPSFEDLASPGCEAAIEGLFEREFADARKLIPDLVGTFLANPTGHMVTIKSDPWNLGGQALLVGDAAHAIVPFFGQGMNCGFEDCLILDGLLKKHGSDWEKIFAEFSRARKPDADAIADMAVENFIEMRDKVGDRAFLMQKEVEKILQKKFTGEYYSRYALVSFSLTPYHVAAEIGRISDGIVAELCRDVNAAQDVDLALASRLIRERMTPYVKTHLLNPKIGA